VNVGTEYQYKGNNNARDGTERLQLSDDRVVELGQTIELSDEEAEGLRRRFNLTKVSDDTKTDEPQGGAPVEGVTQKAAPAEGVQLADTPGTQEAPATAGTSKAGRS